jgi:YgiT-type zinc finger domain-containing protein
MFTEVFEERKVTYVLDLNGRIIIVENVPARVSIETGERLFSPETVERLQRTVWEEHKPQRVVATPVYEFS